MAGQLQDTGFLSKCRRPHITHVSSYEVGMCLFFLFFAALNEYACRMQSSRGCQRLQADDM